MKISTLFFLFLCFSPSASPGIHKCVGPNGSINYSQTACPSAEKSADMDLQIRPAKPSASRNACSTVRDLASNIAEKMRAGLRSPDAIKALGGLGRVQKDSLEILNYVYSFEHVADVGASQIAALSYDKCLARGFSVAIASEQSEMPTTDRSDAATGSGFLINGQGALLTNNHVVDGCRSIRVQLGESFFPAILLHAQAETDLAVIEAPSIRGTPAVFRASDEIVRGERVIAAGYPLQRMLSRQVNITGGIVSSKAGIQEDWSRVQITVPLQPGNSGGPVLDANGLVAGVAVAKLSDIATFQKTGSLPENVNFAIKGGVAKQFLERNGIPFEERTTGDALKNEEIAQIADRFTAFIECHR